MRLYAALLCSLPSLLPLSSLSLFSCSFFLNRPQQQTIIRTQNDTHNARTHHTHTHRHTPHTRTRSSFLALLSPLATLSLPLYLSLFPSLSLLINTQLISVCLSWRNGNGGGACCCRLLAVPPPCSPVPSPFFYSASAAGNNYLRNVIIIIFF